MKAAKRRGEVPSWPRAVVLVSLGWLFAGFPLLICALGVVLR